MGSSILALAFAGCCCTAGLRSRLADFESGTATLPPLRVTEPAAVRAESSMSVTQAQFRHVNFHVAPGIVLEIRRLRGQMLDRRGGGTVVFDDKRSFLIRIATAEVALDTTSLDHLMNDHVFAYRGSPLHDLRFSIAHGELVQNGVMHKIVDIPFQLTAAMSVTPAGLLRLHPTAMKICSIPGKGLMDALGVTLSSLLDLHGATGVTVDRNDLLLDPDRILPAPAISGHVFAVRVEPGKVVQLFGDSAGDAGPPPLHPPDSTARNYMYFRHGTLRFGKLFMVHADMQIIDLDPADPFDFSIDRYNEQLVAGYSRNQPSGGLEVFMPDIGKVKHRASTAKPPTVR